MMFGKSFESLSLDTLGRGIADYLDRAGESVLAFNSVDGIPSVSDIEEDNSSYKQVKAATRFVFDCGVIWGMAYIFLRDEEYKSLSEAEAVKQTEKNIDKFIKEGMKYVSNHDYELPNFYNHKTIIKHAIDAEVGGEDSPFSKGVTFAMVFIQEFYGISMKND